LYKYGLIAIEKIGFWILSVQVVVHQGLSFFLGHQKFVRFSLLLMFPSQPVLVLAYRNFTVCMGFGSSALCTVATVP
jgi:hypothetical protein